MNGQLIPPKYKATFKVIALLSSISEKMSFRWWIYQTEFKAPIKNQIRIAVDPQSYRLIRNKEPTQIIISVIQGSLLIRESVLNTIKPHISVGTTSIRPPGSRREPPRTP